MTSPLTPTITGPGHAQTGQAFEAQMLSSLFAMMLEAAESPDGFDGGHGEAMMRPQLAEALGAETARRATANGSGIGVAALVADQLHRLAQGNP